MVHTTRPGDDGISLISGGTRIYKAALRFQAIGAVEETNSTIGLARIPVSQSDYVIDNMLAGIQHDLFDVVADLSDQIDEHTEYEPVRVSYSQIAKLEANIDKLSMSLTSLNPSVIPCGSAASAHLHQARAVSRRAERAVVALSISKGETVNKNVIAYLNRLSDFLFTAGRYLNKAGRDDVLWSHKNR